VTPKGEYQLAGGIAQAAVEKQAYHPAIVSFEVGNGWLQLNGAKAFLLLRKANCGK
jgi:hypothetical protein